jgi:hypothetical protein
VFEGDSEELEAIEKRLVAALDLGGVRSWDAIVALSNLLVLAWATIGCPDCRRVAADRLRAAIPGMLEAADAMAVDAAESELSAGGEQHLH